MKLSIAAILLLLAPSAQAFVAAPTRSFLSSAVVTPALYSSTELTAADAETEATPEEGVVLDGLPVVGFSSAAAAEEPVAVPEVAPAVADDAKRTVERVRHTLFVGNLPFEAEEGELETMLAEFGEVVVVALPRNRESGRPRGFAFIDMATPEDVQAAIAGMDGRLFNGRVLRATPSVPKEDQPKRTDTDNGMGKMYVGNLAFETTKEELVDFFAEYGTVFEVYMPTNRETGEIRGFGFVNMKKDEIESVIEQTNGLEMNGRTLTVMMPLTKGEKAPRKARTQRTKIYVGNLSFYTVQETLEEVFSEFGEIVDCYIPPDPATGQSRGFGFVTMSPEDAQSAIAELDSCELDGRIIRVNEAQPKGGKRDEEPESDDSEGSADE